MIRRRREWWNASVEAHHVPAGAAALFWAGAARIALLLLQSCRLLWRSYARFSQSVEIRREILARIRAPVLDLR